MSDSVMTMNFQVEVAATTRRVLGEANADGRARIVLPKRLLDEVIRTVACMEKMDGRDLLPVQLQLGAKVLVEPEYGPAVEVSPEMRICVTIYRSDELLERALNYLVAGQAGLEVEHGD
jgi:hypothetical protein